MRTAILALAMMMSVAVAMQLPVPNATNLEGTPLRRVSIRFRSNDETNNNNAAAVSSCAGAFIEDAVDTKPLRSPHEWYSVTPAQQRILGGYASPADASTPVHFFEMVAPVALTPSMPFTTGKTTVLATFEDSKGRVLAHSFPDPRFMRLHAGHHDAGLDLHGRRSSGEAPTTFAGAVGDRLGSIARFFSGIGAPPRSAELESDVNAHHKDDKHHELPSASEALWIPRDVTRVKLYCSNASHPDAELAVPSPGHSRHHADSRSFAAKAAAAAGGDHEVLSLSIVGPPSKVYNIILLSGGFRLEDKDMFVRNATNLANLLRDPSLTPREDQDSDADIADMHRTVPFNRYLHGWNIYAVFQPSVDVGANRPLQGLVVNNNLGCTHPAEMERAVFCDRSLSIALAATTPADVIGDPDRNVIVNLVNTAIYGGSALSIPGKLHFGNFFNGFDLNDVEERKRMLSLVDHELGHAFGDLMDEYSIGISEPNDRKLSNCEYSAGPNPKWKHWIDIKNDNPSGWASVYGAGITAASKGEWSVLDVPQGVCGFTNYYKANEQCMMHRLSDFFMCPVCREAATRAVLRVDFEREWPRKPLKDVVTVIPPANFAFNGSTPAPSESVLTADGEMVLHLGAHLTRGYEVEAFDVDGTPLALLREPDCYNCVLLNKTHFDRYPRNKVIKITFNITDLTDHFVVGDNLEALNSRLKQTTYFRLLLPDSMDTLAASKNLSGNTGTKDSVVGRHSSDLQRVYSYCEAEDPSLNETLVCNMSFPERLYERPLNIDALLASYDQWILIGLGCLALVFLLLWAYAATACTDEANKKARTVFVTKHSCFITLIRRVMLLSSVCFLVASVVAVAVSAYFYYQASTLGKIALAGGVVLAILLYILAFFGFWSVMSRSKRMLVVNGVLLFIAAVTIGFFFVVVIEVGQELQVESSFKIDMGDVSASKALGGNTPAPGTNSSTSSQSGDGTAPGGNPDAQNGFWTNQLKDLWISTVQDDPSTACAIQVMMECTGFYTNCASEYASTLTCPRDCEETNKKYLSPCQSIFKGYIVDNYVYIASATGSSMGMLLGGVAFNIILLMALCFQKKDIRKSNKQRIARRAGASSGAAGGAGAAAAGLPENLQKEEDNKFHALYLLRSLDMSTTKGLVREFKRIDINGDGELSRQEMFLFMKKVLMYKPSAAELDEIFKVGDIDGDGTISFVEFLKLFGCTNTDEALALMESVKNPRRAARVPIPTLPIMIRRKSAANLLGGGGGGPKSPKKQGKDAAMEAGLLHAPEPTGRHGALVAADTSHEPVMLRERAPEPKVCVEPLGVPHQRVPGPHVGVEPLGHRAQPRQNFDDMDDLL
jgi:hypothetical protein